ncbi:MAG: sulfite exporter TauE/SafE family protein [Chloroflexi bacterium]|nr:MAG: sulfite exporter TauE/SafE family protein [Chloroflexota bacterium]
MSWGDALAIVGGLVAGVISGTMGVGGGVVFVPFMTTGYRFTQTLAQGTSLAAIVPTAVVGGFTHIRQGNVLRDAAIWMGAGGLGGAVVGAVVAVHAPSGILARLFALFLFANAFVLVRSALADRTGKTAAP